MRNDLIIDASVKGMQVKLLRILHLQCIVHVDGEFGLLCFCVCGGHYIFLASA